ncbi:MAG: diguanylate cyclase [Lachnospiraceae bacterium]|nr:diguanylate cyclase [Lachnospiraceae bacterium]
MKNILIVDDDKINCMIAKHALGTDYRVVAAYSGMEALEYLETELPDLILMDIEMPEMNGKEVAKRIKEQDKWAKIPIIFLTADTDPATEVECLEWGADDFITKPFVPPIMTSRVSRVLELHELRKDLETQLEKKTRQMEQATLKSLTDALTGLHNRDYLETNLQELLGEGHGGTLFMIDLDNFKTMNDTYGHIVGDKTLQYFAEVLKLHADEKDIVCRLAGDEFVTFYTDLTDKEAAARKATGIIRMFSEKMGVLGYPGIVSVSVGIMITDGSESFQSLYNKADKSLYFVKNNGKNAYHIYGEHKDTPEEINTIVDLEVVRHMMEDGLENSKGAFHVAYDEFKKIYDFVIRYVERKQQEMQIVLFTLELKEQSSLTIENAMSILETSVITSLRSMDAGTKYSNKQYIVLLLDTNRENGRLVAERVINKFYNNCKNSGGKVKITYDIQTREPN